MPDATGLLILALASWRVSVFLVRERGPFDVALRIRRWAGIDHTEEGEPIGFPETGIGAALGCIYCTSVWVAPVMLGLWLTGPGLVLVLWLAVAGGAVVVDVAIGRLGQR